MTILEIIQLSVIGIALVATLIYCIVMGVKNKWFSKLWVVMGVKNKWFSKLWETIKLAIKEAETKFPESGSGDKKKAYVLEQVEIKCIELGIPYSLLKKLISLAIDKIIDDYNIIKK